MRDKINQHLNQFDLDLRKTGDARFSDQKCTPDVVCFIADCVMTSFDDRRWFTVNDIWQSQYFITNVRAIFGKPWADDERVKHEYDKFIQQPLRMLSYARILDIDKGSPNRYRINNGEILEYISLKERNTYNFLYCYFEKLLRDSGEWEHFERYIKSPNRHTFMDLKDRFDRFILGFTPINTAVEVHRIFPKILNVIAVEHNIQGTEKGRISKYAFSFSDLMYNRKNWRDMNKDKTMSRQEARELNDAAQQEAYNAYYVQKAIALIRKIQTESEVHDQYAIGDATQVHHIFPKSQYPEIAHYLENLILLTATQHFTKAHPDNKTQTVNKDYQLTCLLAKADTIKKSYNSVGEKYYRKESFVFVINTGLETSEFLTTESLEDIKTKLIQFYNAA